MNIVTKEFELLFERIEALIRTKKQVLVAIDGNSGAGKSTLAEKLRLKVDCNIFRMDDFFLQPFQRKPERLAESGGNIDYERFGEEVLTPLLTGKSFIYRRYDCVSGDINKGKKISVQPAQLNIIEGVYSMHPRFGDVYDLKVFLKVGEKEQHRRLKERNPALLPQFLNEWLPMEKLYFETFGIEDSCQLIIKEK
ncbi:MAG: uridine kinase [Oscillospiraceae bacterium]|nr:uridine kinase [Oscillospiraceae bacterium]